MILDGFGHYEIVLLGLLLYDAYAQYILYIQLSAAFEDGKLRAIDLDVAVVYAQCEEGREAMLYGADTLCAIGEYGAALCLIHILGQSLDEC